MSKKMVACKACGEEIAKDAAKCPKCGAKNKKPIFKKWWFWLIVVWIVLCIVKGGSDTPSDADTPTEPNNTSPTSTQSTIPEVTVSIELVAGEVGEYGELFTINKGTEFEETYYIYHVPAGTYKVKNIGEYMAQITVCSDEVNVTDEGWEEPAEVFYAKALKPGQSDTFTIDDGQYIEIHEPAKFKIEQVG